MHPATHSAPPHPAPQATDTPTPAPATGQPRRCLVLGGSGYVGQATCRALHAAGCQVAFTWHRNAAAALALQNACPGMEALQVDFEQTGALTEAVQTLGQRWGGLDVLVQAAGVPLHDWAQQNGTHPTLSAAECHSLYTVLVNATLQAARAVQTWMEAGGAIVVISAIDGLRTLPSPPHYAAAKGAQVALVRALAQELGPHQICVNSVAPGLLEQGVAQYTTEAQRQDYLSHCSLGRFGKSEEVAQWVVWLALENTYLTAQHIVLDGAL